MRMDMRTYVRFIVDGEAVGNEEYRAGKVGYIEGFCRDVHGNIRAIVVCDTQIFPAPLFDLEVMIPN